MENTQNTLYQPKKSKTGAKIILFDLDGTLIDSTQAILESFQKAYKSFNQELPDNEKIKSLIGLPLETMFVKLGIPKSQAISYVKLYKAHYKTIHTQKTLLLPHAKEALDLAKSYGKLGVVTTKTSEYSRNLLEHFDIMQHFDILIGREEVTHPKPNPEPIKRAIDALGHHYNKTTYMIGDTMADIIAAQKANITSIGVLCGYGKKEDLVKHADFVAKDTYSAVQLIERI